MKGGAGFRDDWREETEVTRGLDPASASVIAVAVAASPMTGFFPSTRTRSATNVVPSGATRRTSIVQYSTATKARISRSRSTTRRTATDCTRPADSPARTLRQSSGLSV